MHVAPLALLLCLSCVPRQPRTLPEAPGGLTAEASEPAAGGLLLQGFSIVWQARPHRVSRLRFGAQGTRTTSDPNIDGQLFADVRGGTWASGKMAFDRPDVQVLYASLSGPGLTVIPGEVELVIRGGLGPRDAENKVPEESVDAVLELPATGPWEGAVVWLTAVDLSTAPSHPNGYTPNAIAVDLGPPRIEGDRARVAVHARVEAAPTFDRVQRLKSYGATVRVGFAVVLTTGGVGRREHIATRLDGGLDPDEGPRRVPEDHIHFAVPLGEGFPQAIGGLSGFSLDIRQTGPASGRYVRAMSAGLEDERYDPETGRYSGEVALRFTNAGSAARPARVDASAVVSVLALRQPVAISTGRWSPGDATGASCAHYPDLEPTPCATQPFQTEQSPSPAASAQE